jgi:hypothetical protein
MLFSTTIQGLITSKFMKNTFHQIKNGRRNKMPTLNDVLKALHQLEIDPSELQIPTFIYSYLINEAQRIADNDVCDESDEDNENSGDDD